MSNYLDDFFQKTYEQETLRKHQFATYLPLRITLTIIVGGILGTNVSSASVPSSIFQQLGFGLAVAGSVSLLITVFLLFRFHFGHAYNYLSYPDETSEFIKNLKSFHDEKFDRFEKETKEHLQKEYIECGTENMKINDKRSATIYRTDQFLGIAAVLAMFSYWSYVSHSVIVENSEHKIAILEENQYGRSIGKAGTGPNTSSSVNSGKTGSAATKNHQGKRNSTSED